jgi:hypothetical protein
MFGFTLATSHAQHRIRPTHERFAHPYNLEPITYNLPIR